MKTLFRLLLLLGSAATVFAVAPTVSVTAPAAGAVIPVGSSMYLRSTATDTDGVIASVEFYVDGVLVGTVTNAAAGGTYNFAYTFGTAGTVNIFARARDNAGDTADSAAVSVSVVPAVGTGPTVTITTPTGSDTFASNVNVAVTASATDADGFIPSGAGQGVTFLVDGEPITPTGSEVNPDLTPPYTLTWRTGVAKVYDLRAQAADDKGNIRLSPRLLITVTSPIPTVTITAPVTGAIVTLGSPVTIAATAAATSGSTVSRVEFFADGVLLGSDATSPYSATWTPGLVRSTPYRLTARVVDSNGSIATSDPVDVTVVANTPPTVSMVTPAENAVAPVNAALVLTATASDVDIGGSITSVTFYANGTSIGAGTAVPGSPGTYRLSWTPTTAGTYAITATATDNGGATTATAARNVTITAAGVTPPTVTIGLGGGSVNVPVGSSRFVTANASDADGVIERVEFFMDGVLQATDTTAPYVYVFTAPESVGAHQLMARAYDNSGLTADSALLAIQIGNPIGTLPQAAILTPTSGSFSAINASVAINVTAADADGTVSAVQVYANGTLLGGAGFSNGLWTINWTPTVAGVYSLIAVATDNSGNAVASPSIGLNVTDNTSPTISLTLSPRTAGAAASTTMPSGAVRNIVADANASAGRAIVRVEFFVNGTKLSEDTTEPYTYRYFAPELPTGAQRQTYVVTVRATDNAGMARDVHQVFTVISPIGLPPSVTLLTPTSGLNTVPGTAVSLAATAVASGGTIASVQFYANGSPAGINGANGVANPPYTTSFVPTAPGVYIIDAIATDDRGNTTVSNNAAITVAFVTPTIVFTAPNPNATARATPNVPMTLAATATAGAGSSILLVEFLLDGAQIGADTSAPYSVSWLPTTAHLGEHVLTARVTDTNAQTVTSNPIPVNVANVVGSPPSVSVSVSPPATSTPFGLQTASTVNFIANAVATGTGSTLRSVEIYLNDVSIGTAAREQSTNLYRLAYDFNRFDFTAVPPTINDQTGAVTYPIRLYAIARDSNNNQTVSQTQNLVVNPATSSPPSIQLQALSPTNITAATQFFVLPNFNDLDGQVTSIQLYANGSLVGTTGAPQLGTPISFTTSNTAGRYNLYAVAFDDSGNTAVSSPAIVINVAALNPPTTTIEQPADNTTTTVNAPIFLQGTAVNRDTTATPSLQFIATASRGARTSITGIRVGTTDTYRAIWTPTVADSYTLTTQATVGSVSATSTTSRRVVVSNVQGLAPTVSINVPGSATTASTSNFTATATDSDGSVVGVEFFLDRNSIGQAVKDPIGNTWRLTASFAGLSLGGKEVVARATDSSGNVAASPTSNVNITAATSIAPTVTITPSNDNPAFNRQVQLRATASDSDGTVSSVQYWANAAVIGSSSNSGTSYLVNWTPTASGTYNVWALATDNSGITRVSAAVPVVVRRNNPILEDAAFILQSYLDIANTSTINPLVFDDLDTRLGAGTLTRADLIAGDRAVVGVEPLVGMSGFQAPVNLLAAYWVLMGQWPTPQNYTTLLSTARNNFSTAVGNILASNEYVAKWGAAPTVTLLNTTTSVLPADVFIERLWRGAGLGTPSPLNNLQFRSNNTATPTLGRGYNPAGLNVAVAEFITNTNSTNTALLNRARAAALFYQLIRPPITMTIEEISAKIAAIAEQPDMRAMADAVLKDVLYVYRYVTITKHPTSLVVSPRSGALFSVEALGQPPLSYQWMLNGAQIPGATSSILSLTNVDTTRVGTYTVVVTSSVAQPAVSDPATLTLTNTPTKLANISTRGVTSGGNNVLIAGFIVAGNATQTRQILIRAVGPRLGAAPFNLTGFLADPELEVYRGESSTPILTNDDWGTQTGGATALAALRQATTRAGAFTLNNNSRDAAILATLPPGPYTVMAKGPANDPSGLVLVEVYDVTQGGPAGAKTENVSTRGMVGSGENMLIAGFVVNGEAMRRVLIRGVGPTLQRFGLPAASLVANPQLRLIKQETGETIATNDDWADTPDEGALAAAAARASNAFPLVNGSRDAALVLMLAPGAYTVQLSGVGGSTGIGIVEVYDVDP